MKTGVPVSLKEVAPEQRRRLDDLYAQVLSLREGEALPITFPTKLKARSFANNVHAKTRRPHRIGIRAAMRGRTVYLYRTSMLAEVSANARAEA